MRIKPDFPSWKPIACGFSRDKKNEHGVFAPRARRRCKSENPVVKRASEASPQNLLMRYLDIVCGPGYPHEVVCCFIDAIFGWCAR